MNPTALHVRAGGFLAAIRPRPWRAGAHAAPTGDAAFACLTVLFGRLRRFRHRAARARAIHETAAALAALDDRLLRDIGVARHEIPVRAQELVDKRRADLRPARPSLILTWTRAAAKRAAPTGPHLRRAA
jgi:uncharacterized protein YjiS (DUF1127 family)